MRLWIRSIFSQVIEVQIPPAKFWEEKPAIVPSEEDRFLEFTIGFRLNSIQWDECDTMILVPNVKGDMFEFDYQKIMGTYTLDCSNHLQFHNKNGDRFEGLVEFEFYYWIEQGSQV